MISNGESNHTSLKDAVDALSLADISEEIKKYREELREPDTSKYSSSRARMSLKTKDVPAVITPIIEIDFGDESYSQQLPAKFELPPYNCTPHEILRLPFIDIDCLQKSKWSRRIATLFMSIQITFLYSSFVFYSFILCS